MGSFLPFFVLPPFLPSFFLSFYLSFFLSFFLSCFPFLPFLPFRSVPSSRSFRPSFPLSLGFLPPWSCLPGSYFLDLLSTLLSLPLIPPPCNLPFAEERRRDTKRFLPSSSRYLRGDIQEGRKEGRKGGYSGRKGIKEERLEGRMLRKHIKEAY